MLLSSLREVISNQAHEIQTLQKSVKDFSTSSKIKDDEVGAVYRPSSLPDLLNGSLDYVSQSPGGIADKSNHRRGREEEGE